MGCGCGENKDKLVQKASVYEISIKIESEPYNFFVRGVVLTAPSPSPEELAKYVARFFITNSGHVTLEHHVKLYDVLFSQSYSDSEFKTYYWCIIPSLDGYISILSPYRMENYTITEFYIKGIPPTNAPLLPYILRDIIR